MTKISVLLTEPQDDALDMFADELDTTKSRIVRRGILLAAEKHLTGEQYDQVQDAYHSL